MNGMPFNNDNDIVQVWQMWNLESRQYWYFNKKNNTMFDMLLLSHNEHQWNKTVDIVNCHCIFQLH